MQRIKKGLGRGRAQRHYVPKRFNMLVPGTRDTRAMESRANKPDWSGQFPCLQRPLRLIST